MATITTIINGVKTVTQNGKVISRTLLVNPGYQEVESSPQLLWTGIINNPTKIVNIATLTPAVFRGHAVNPNPYYPNLPSAWVEGPFWSTKYYSAVYAHYSIANGWITQNWTTSP